MWFVLLQWVWKNHSLCQKCITTLRTRQKHQLVSQDAEISAATPASWVPLDPLSLLLPPIPHFRSNINSHVIYCITCKKCREQYVGETEQELHCRQRGHLHDINSNKSGLPYVTHFRKCGIENYTITAIEKVRQNNTDIRRAREKYYKQLFDVKI